MYTIKDIYKAEQTISKSLFICEIFPIKNNLEASDILTKIRKNYYDATHNCYAYIYGENGEFCKSSDDGEPSQTAGVVILDVLKKNNLTNVLAVVTRYFGGIKLGAGGLVRAYSSSTALALKEASLIPIITLVKFKIVCNYQNYNQILNILNKNKDETSIKEISKSFEDKIELIYEINITYFEETKNFLIDATKNQILVSTI